MDIQRYPFHVGPYDLRVKDRMQKAYPEWARVIEERKDEFPDFAGFMDTLFLDLWKPTASTMVNPEAGMEALQMMQVLDIAHAMPQWKTMKERTQNKAALSTLASMHLGRLIQFPEPPEGDDSDGDSEGEGDGSNNPSTGEGDNDSKARGEITPEIRAAIQEAVEQAAQDVEDGDTLTRLWGTELGEDWDGDPVKLYQMVQQLRSSPRLRAALMLLGRMRNQMRNVRMTKANYIPEEFVDVELGNDLSKLMPSTRLLLADPELDILFMLKYIQHSLFQQVKHGNTTEARGPIIVMVDTSSSMSWNLGKYPGVGAVSRYDWAIAVGLTLAIMAAEDNRDFYLGLFHTQMGRVFTSKSKMLDSKDIAELLAVKPSGGTSFDPPLWKTLDLLRQTEYRKADLVFVTDGECQVSTTVIQELEKAKEEHGFNIFGVVCGVAGDSLKDFCDDVTPVGSITDADKSADKLFAM